MLCTHQSLYLQNSFEGGTLRISVIQRGQLRHGGIVIKWQCCGTRGQNTVEQRGPGKVADRRRNQNPTESQPVGIKRTNEQKAYTNRLDFLKS